MKTRTFTTTDFLEQEVNNVPLPEGCSVYDQEIAVKWSAEIISDPNGVNAIVPHIESVHLFVRIEDEHGEEFDTESWVWRDETIVRFTFEQTLGSGYTLNDIEIDVEHEIIKLTFG